MRLLLDQNLSHRLLASVDLTHSKIRNSIDRIRLLDQPVAEVEVIEIW